MLASRLLRGLVVLMAGLYVASILGVIVALRFVGERWWPTTAGLYMPRVVLAAPLPVLALALVALKLYRLLWTQVIASLLLMFPLMGFVVPRPTLRKSDAPVVRLLSYNVDSGNLGYAGVVDEVVRASPDIVFLQEVGGPVDDLVQRLKEHYSTVVVTGQLALATHYDLVTETDPQKIAYNGRARSPRFARYLIDTPIGRIAFYNVHPISPRSGLYALRSGGLRHKILSGHWLTEFDASVLMGETGLRAAQMRDAAQGAAQETLPVVIAGDTNLPGLSRILNDNLSSYQDGFATVGWGFGYTFPTGKPWMRIDRVFASQALRFVGFHVGRSDASDHLCVVADLQAR
jgi:endonuclease/exonuclease/phosphatase family metal-dependent hydrolase